MRKYRSWLMGLGIGLILGASMLQLITMSQKQLAMDAVPPVITREQLEEEAKKSGLLLMTSEQLKDRLAKEVTAALEESQSVPTEPISDSEDVSEPLNREDAPDDVDTPEAANSNETEVELYVPYKMTLTEVADKLHTLGVIDDPDAFIVAARSISKKLSVGTSIFTNEMTDTEIMAELTSEKKY